jgi:signal transduction histidine kinase
MNVEGTPDTRLLPLAHGSSSSERPGLIRRRYSQAKNDRERSGRSLPGPLHAERDAMVIKHIHYAGLAQTIRALRAEIAERKIAEEALLEDNRRKDEFLATLAHELRNPLACIHNAAGVLRSQAASPSNRKIAREMIERQNSSMARMVDDLVDFSRVTRGQIHLMRESLDVATMVTRAVEATQHARRGGQLDLQVTVPQTPLFVDADPMRFEQVLNNLLLNSFKYIQPGGHVWVTIEQEPAQTGGESGSPRPPRMEGVVVSVRDDGIGIPAEVLPTVFDLFAQGDQSHAHSNHGLGIGLTVAKRLVEMHGGSIEAHSAGSGLGSEFIVRLPTTSAPAPSPSVSPDEIPFP